MTSELLSLLLLPVTNNKTSSNVNHNTFIRRKTSLQGAQATTKAAWDKYSDRSYTSTRDYFGEVAVMLGALGSADKYSTESVSHSSELSRHCWSQNLQYCPPALRPSPNAPIRRHQRLLRWCNMLRRTSSIFPSLFQLLIFSFPSLSITIIFPLT